MIKLSSITKPLRIVIGIVLVVLGTLLILSFFGMILGIPVLILGISCLRNEIIFGTRVVAFLSALTILWLIMPDQKLFNLNHVAWFSLAIILMVYAVFIMNLVNRLCRYFKHFSDLKG